MLLREKPELRVRLQRRPDLMRRAVRIAVFRKAKGLAAVAVRWVARRRMWRREKARYAALVGALEGCAKAAERARRNKFQASEAVLNLALYFLIAERDIQLVKVDALTHPDAWRRSLSSRVILLTLHELELDKAGGKRLRQALEDASVPESLRQEVAEALRMVRSAQQKAQKLFATLRNSTIAHRDSDAITQYRQITELDGLLVLKASADFYTGVEAFMKVMPRLLMHVGGMQGLFSQLIAQVKKKTHEQSNP